MSGPGANLQVAVIVPVFNRLDLLRQTVASLRAQTMDRAEFILVDDCSDEATWRFLQSLPGLDSRFQIVRKPETQPRGCQASRNLGFELSRAEMVVFLDSDDLLGPECLVDRYHTLADHPDADLLVGRQAMFWEDAGPLRWVNVPLPAKADLERCLDLLDPLDVPWVNGGVMIRAAKLRQMGVIWSPRFHWDDLAFHFMCLVKGLRTCWMKYDGSPPDSYYRKHAGLHYGQTLQSVDGLRNCASMMAWMKEQLVLAGEWTEARREALVRSYFHVCVLKPIDDRKYRLAGELAEFGFGRGLLTGFEKRRFMCYAVVRRVLETSTRATYFWNRWARMTFLRESFTNTVWTYGSVCPPSPVAETALAGLLRAFAADSSHL